MKIREKLEAELKDENKPDAYELQMMGVTSEKESDTPQEDEDKKEVRPSSRRITNSLDRNPDPPKRVSDQRANTEL